MAKIEDMTAEQLRAEVRFWRQDAAARLATGRALAAAAVMNGDEGRETDLRLNILLPTRAALRQALAGEYDDFHCEACGEPIKDGDLCFSEHEGGYLHAMCMGEVTSTEGFVDPDGKPLPPGSPIPRPFSYVDGFSPERIEAELALANVYLGVEGAA